MARTSSGSPLKQAWTNDGCKQRQSRLHQTETVWEQLTVASRSVRPRLTSCLMAPRLWLKQDRTRVEASEKAMQFDRDAPLLITVDIIEAKSSNSKFSTQTDITLRPKTSSAAELLWWARTHVTSESHAHKWSSRDGTRSPDQQLGSGRVTGQCVRPENQYLPLFVKNTVTVYFWVRKL